MVDVGSTSRRDRRASASLAGLLGELGPVARERLGTLDGEAFLARLEDSHRDVHEPIQMLYGGRTDPDVLVRELVMDVLDAAEDRPQPLRVLDRRREVNPGWFQRSRMIGYVCYADRFAGSLAAVRQRLDYLDELGVTYLHLMPLLAPREGENDGGYAVADYDAVDPRLGTMGDLEDLAADLHDRGTALCVDLVLNHTAREHEWARRAMAGDAAYRDFYFVYPDRSEPDAWERTLPEVFPDRAPGSFSHVPEMGGWVWTTFFDYQWDLDYTNPAVFRAMLRTMLTLANRGVDVLRLDAVPFIWKRLGTNCQNQYEAHLIVQACRALTRIAAPGLLLKAEAIVAPDDLVQYLGAHDRFRPECDLAYNNQLMVMLWSSLATRDVRLAAHALTRMRSVPPSSGWVTYLRCHDDIGWAISDEDASAVGWNGYAHRTFLSDFYAGSFPGSFARGLRFQQNPATGDARISGSAASLCGIEAAVDAGDEAQLDLAIHRLETLYSVVFSFGGIPLIYMGDELGLCNDARWADDPAHADDNRWIHRQTMDWTIAARRTNPATVEGRVFRAVHGLVEARRSQLALRLGGDTQVLDAQRHRVLAYRRLHPRSGPLLALANFGEDPEWISSGFIHHAGVIDPEIAYAGSAEPQLTDGGVLVPSWGFVWLTES